MSVASPCSNVCRMNPASGFCEGCFRTIDEIAQWSRQDDAARLRILDAVARRRQEAGVPTQRTAMAEVRG